MESVTSKMIPTSTADLRVPTAACSLLGLDAVPELWQRTWPQSARSFTPRGVLFLEHGHADNLAHDYSSTAYWYQTEPHWHCVELLPVEARLPRLWGGVHI
jgi:hypothetical protein